MNRGPVLTVALGVLFALGACSDGTSSLPTDETPAMLVGGGPACNPTELKKATEVLFGKRSAQVAIAGNFKPSTVNTAAVTPSAYALFAAIATLRNGLGWGAELTDEAALLATHITACSDLAFSDAELSLEFASLNGVFTGALGADGTFQVRGGSYGNLGAVAANDQAEFTAPLSFWNGSPALILGQGTSSFTSEAPGGYEYDWIFLRPSTALELSGVAALWMCAPAALTLGPAALRLEHQSAPGTSNIIPIPTAAAPAPGIACESLVSAVPVPTSLAGRMFRTLTDVFAPAPLYAAAGSYGPVGGLLGSFSPVEVVYPEQVVVTFTTEPTDGFVNVSNPVEVKVTAAGGTPWEDVVVELLPVANDGQPLFLCGNVDTTNAAGVATFPNFRVSNPGGLFVVASVTEPGTDEDVTYYYDTAAADSSQRFNVRPTTATGTACP